MYKHTQLTQAIPYYVHVYLHKHAFTTVKSNGKFLAVPVACVGISFILFYFVSIFQTLCMCASMYVALKPTEWKLKHSKLRYTHTQTHTAYKRTHAQRIYTQRIHVYRGEYRVRLNHSRQFTHRVQFHNSIQFNSFVLFDSSSTCLVLALFFAVLHKTSQWN